MDKNVFKDAIKAASSLDDIYSALSMVEAKDLRSSEVEMIARKLNHYSDQSNLKIAYLGNYTLDPLPSYVTTKAACEKFLTAQYVGAYDQYYQEVLSPQNGLTSFAPNVIVLALSMRKLAPEIVSEFGALTVNQIQEFFTEIISNISEWVTLTKKHNNAEILLYNFARPLFRNQGIADLSSPFNETLFYYKLNTELINLFQTDSQVHIVDIDGLVARYGSERAFSPKLSYLAKMEWSEGFQLYIADEIVRYLKAFLGLTKKCLVLDLDNTLWGGILGEDGVNGIRIGKGNPEAEAFLDFQYAIRSLKHRGIILAINSKNNIEDVKEAFQLRSEMPLQLNDFSAVRANWNNKHENLIEIAEELNIGLESIVFVDDNPVECELVKEMLPEVSVISLPKDSTQYPTIIQRTSYFEKITITQEDRFKANQYTQNKERSKLKNDIKDLDSYLKSLQTTISIKTPEYEHIPRVHQLFSKTNQFNLTTKRYGITEIQNIIKNKNNIIKILSVKDRFGDLGIVGLYLINANSKNFNIDSFILSCRAMGRGIETAIMNELKQTCAEINVKAFVHAAYIPTKKNVPVEDFYESQGFSIQAIEENGTKTYAYDLSNLSYAPCDHITVSTVGE